MTLGLARPRPHTRRLSPALLALVVSVGLGSTGCGGEAGSRQESTTNSPSPAPTTPTTPPGDTGSTGSTSERYRTHPIADTDLTLDLPASWTILDREAIDQVLSGTGDAGLSPESEVPREQLAQAAASNTALFATAPRRRPEDFVSTVNVLVLPTTAPTPESMLAQYRGMGASDLQIGEVETAVGTAGTVAYTLDVGAFSAIGRTLLLDVDGEAVVITLASGDAATASQLARRITTSLTRA